MNLQVQDIRIQEKQNKRKDEFCILSDFEEKTSEKVHYFFFKKLTLLI